MSHLALNLVLQIGSGDNCWIHYCVSFPTKVPAQQLDHGELFFFFKESVTPPLDWAVKLAGSHLNEQRGQLAVSQSKRAYTHNQGECVCV